MLMGVYVAHRDVLSRYGCIVVLTCRELCVRAASPVTSKIQA